MVELDDYRDVASTSQLSRDIHFRMAKRIRKYIGAVQIDP